MRTRIVRAVVLATLALTAMTGAAQAAPTVTASQANNTTLSGASAVAISGNYAYSVGYWSGQLCVFDVSNPAVGPTPVGTCTASTPAMAAATNIAISGNDAFVTSKNRNASPTSNDDGTGNSLTVVDISNPTAPSIVGTVHDSTNLFGAEGVAVSGHYAYVASQGLLTGQPTSPDTSTGSFSVIDLNHLAGGVVFSIANSSLTGTQTNALEHATSVAIEGNYAFVTAQYPTTGSPASTVTAIDIGTNPAAPTIVGTYSSTSHKLDAANDIAVSGNYAYVANQNTTGSELTVLNISNPAAITGVSSLSNILLEGAYSITLRGTIAYVAANDAAAVDAVDISNPLTPTLIGSVVDMTNLRNATSVAVDPNGQYVLAASPSNGATLGPTFPPYPFQTGGPTAPTGTIAMIGLTAVITPATEPSNPTTSTSANFAFTSSDSSATFTCSLDGGAASACPGSQSYASLSAGSHTFTVRATDAFGLTSPPASYTWTVSQQQTPPPPPPPPSPPVNTVAPAISGTPTLGMTLTVGNGTWSQASSFTDQWVRCTAAGTACSPISGATAASYTIVTADLGHRLEAVVTGESNSLTAAASTAATGVVGWPSGPYGSGSVHVSRTAGGSLSLSLPTPGASLQLTSLVIGLPKGLSWAGPAAHLGKGLVVTDGTGKKLKYKLSLSHGKATLTFANPPTAVKLTVKAGFAKVSAALARQLASHKTKTLTGSLTADYQGTPARLGTVILKVH